MPVIEMAGAGPYEFDGSPIEYNLTLWRGSDYRFWFRIRGREPNPEFPNDRSADVFVPLDRNEGLGWHPYAEFREKVTGQPGAIPPEPIPLEIEWAPGTEVEFYVFWSRDVTRSLPKKGGWELDIRDSIGEERPYYAGRVTPRGEWSVPPESP